MTLAECNQAIEKYLNDTNLSSGARKAGLLNLAGSIERAAWNTWAKPEAKQIAARAQSLADEIDGDELAGLEELVTAGYLRSVD